MRFCVVLSCLLIAAALLITGCSLIPCMSHESTNLNSPMDNHYLLVSETAKYNIYFDGTDYILRLDDSLHSSTIPEYEPGTQIVVQYPTFSSVDEMKEAILKGNFSEQDLGIMTTVFERNSSGDIVICNPSVIYAPTIPLNASIYRIEWYGEHYCYTFSDGSYTGSFSFCSESDYTKEMEKNHTKFYENERVNLTSTSKENDRDSTVFYYITSTGEMKNIHYSFTNKEQGIHVSFCERYRLYESPTTPTSIHFAGYQNGVFFYGSFYGLDSRPSYEWLQSICVIDS